MKFQITNGKLYSSVNIEFLFIRSKFHTDENDVSSKLVFRKLKEEIRNAIRLRSTNQFDFEVLVFYLSLEIRI